MGLTNENKESKLSFAHLGPLSPLRNRIGTSGLGGISQPVSPIKFRGSPATTAQLHRFFSPVLKSITSASNTTQATRCRSASETISRDDVFAQSERESSQRIEASGQSIQELTQNELEAVHNDPSATFNFNHRRAISENSSEVHVTASPGLSGINRWSIYPNRRHNVFSPNEAYQQFSRLYFARLGMKIGFTNFKVSA
jgi:hypothetical protein